MTKPTSPVSPDLSTIDWARLAKVAPSYHVDDREGNGCSGQPPGHPSYFTRSIWTRHGNHPGRGPIMVIKAPDGTLYAVNGDKAVDLDKIYLPLPIDHPRVKTWIYSTMRHHQHCFSDDAGIVPRAKHYLPSDKMVIFPVPNYHLRTFTDDPRFSDAWRETEKAAIAQHNKEIIETTAKVATIGNHQGVRMIRKWYPDWTPTTLDSAAFKCPTGDWYERHAKRPSARTCPGPFFGPHRDDDCQFCGMGRE